MTKHLVNSSSTLKPFLLSHDEEEKDDVIPQTKPIIRCTRCSRPLSNIKSIERKMGYTCSKKTLS